MILFISIYSLIGFFLLMYTLKISDSTFFIGIIMLGVCGLIFQTIMTSTLSDEKINTYSKQITEIKAEQYDIKDKNSEEYKENEDKIIDLIIKYNDEVSKYNDILKKDKNKPILFRWYLNREELELYDLEATTEYTAPDYYRG